MEAYKKACVNKARPKMHCNGRCQMMKKLKKQEGANGNTAPVPKFNETEIVLSSKSFFPSIAYTNEISSNTFYTYHSVVVSNYIGSIFHPPGA